VSSRVQPGTRRCLIELANRHTWGLPTGQPPSRREAVPLRPVTGDVQAICASGRGASGFETSTTINRPASRARAATLDLDRDLRDSREHLERRVDPVRISAEAESELAVRKSRQQKSAALRRHGFDAEVGHLHANARGIGTGQITGGNHGSHQLPFARRSRDLRCLLASREPEQRDEDWKEKSGSHVVPPKRRKGRYAPFVKSPGDAPWVAESSSAMSELRSSTLIAPNRDAFCELAHKTAVSSLEIARIHQVDPRLALRSEGPCRDSRVLPSG